MQIPTWVKCPGCSDRKNMMPRRPGVRITLLGKGSCRTLNGAVTGKPRSELREPQATEARSFVWVQGPCGSAKPVVALAGDVVRCVACSAALASPPACLRLLGKASDLPGHRTCVPRRSA